MKQLSKQSNTLQLTSDYSFDTHAHLSGIPVTQRAFEMRNANILRRRSKNRQILDKNHKIKAMIISSFKPTLSKNATRIASAACRDDVFAPIERRQFRSNSVSTKTNYKAPGKKFLDNELSSAWSSNQSAWEAVLQNLTKT